VADDLGVTAPAMFAVPRYACFQRTHTGTFGMAPKRPRPNCGPRTNALFGASGEQRVRSAL